MGVTFRSGGYLRHVYLGKRTVKDGEACAIWNDRGQHRQIIGPRRVWLYNATVRFLTRHKAEAHQFLRVRHRDGRVEYVYGPASMYENPAMHDEITVHDGISLYSGTECIFVFGASTSTKSEKEGVPPESAADVVAHSSSETVGKREQRIVRGPTLFLPSEGETVHKFVWSGTSGGPTLIKNRHEFNVLDTGKNRMWNVTVPVTTSDLATFSVHLSFGYSILSLEKILLCKDPIEKMFAALRADGQALGNTISSDHIRPGSKEDVSVRLATLQTYPFLVSAAEAAGFTIDSVSITDLRHGEQLQRQANKEKELAAKLRAEKAEQAQRHEMYELDQLNKEQQLAAKLRTEKAEKAQRNELYGLDLEDRRQRIEREAELQRKQIEATAKLEEDSHAMKEAAVDRKLALQRKETKAKNQLTAEEDMAVVEFLKALKVMGVDMTEFMCTAGGMKVGSTALSRAAALGRSVGKKEVKVAAPFPEVAWDKK